MNEHTPGPWEIVPEGNNFHSHTISMRNPEGVRWAAVAKTQQGNTIYPHLTISAKQQLANARLIASAPDLLEALEELELHCRAGGFPNDVLKQSRAAIAKATDHEEPRYGRQ